MSAVGSVERALALFEAKVAFAAEPESLDAALAYQRWRDGGRGGAYRPLFGSVRTAVDLLDRLAAHRVQPAVVEAMVRYDLDEDVITLAVDAGMTGEEINEMLASGGSLDPATIRFMAAMH